MSNYFGGVDVRFPLFADGQSMWHGCSVQRKDGARLDLLTFDVQYRVLNLVCLKCVAPTACQNQVKSVVSATVRPRVHMISSSLGVRNLAETVLTDSAIDAI